MSSPVESRETPRHDRLFRPRRPFRPHRRALQRRRHPAMGQRHDDAERRRRDAGRKHGAAACDAPRPGDRRPHRRLARGGRKRRRSRRLGEGQPARDPARLDGRHRAARRSRRGIEQGGLGLRDALAASAGRFRFRGVAALSRRGAEPPAPDRQGQGREARRLALRRVAQRLRARRQLGKDRRALRRSRRLPARLHAGSDGGAGAPAGTAGARRSVRDRDSSARSACA